jgi:hypothetical protein
MDILAAKTQTLQPKNKAQDSLNTKDRRIAVRINAIQYCTLLNKLTSMHNSGDYSYGSISDILRDVLLKMEHKELTLSDLELHTNDSKYHELILRVTAEQKKFWQSLPKGSRRKILEKAILAFTKIG